MWTPSIALTTLVTFAALVTFVTGDPNQNDTDYGQYELLLHKGVMGNNLNEKRGPFFVPDGQCSGVLRNEMICNDGWPPNGVRIIVQDGAPYPLVALDHSLQNASVVRASPCLGTAKVTLHLACWE